MDAHQLRKQLADICEYALMERRYEIGAGSVARVLPPVSVERQSDSIVLVAVGNGDTGLTIFRVEVS